MLIFLPQHVRFKYYWFASAPALAAIVYLGLRFIPRNRFALPMKRFATLSLLLVGFAVSSFAQERFAFSPNISYNASIPSPATFLGYELGEEYTPYHRTVEYLKAVADASDRVMLVEYGRSYEQRPLYLAIITSPANHARLDDIKAANLQLAQGSNLSDADAAAIIGSNPAVSWLSYNVHGNEASTTETAKQVIYRLAAGQDAETQRILEESVVIIDPCINPDGRSRYIDWYRAMQSNVLNDDANDLEHVENWPGGRTNHYWFDLNRDWVWLVHPESQGRIAAYNEWLPQIHVDYHEQGFNNNYFTMPGQPPRNLNLPAAYDTWAETFGTANADAFDRHKINYFTREAFDFFYPGYGSSYPSLMGSIGMLTEQGGHSRGGRAVETNDGYVLTLRQRIFDHYTTSFASLVTVVENRADLQQYFRDFFTPAANESATKAYLLPDNPNDYTYDVIKLMLDHDVVVHRADDGFTVNDARDYWEDTPNRTAFEAGTFVISTDQPKHVFINTILQREMAIEDSVMYDMSSWSAPIAYNLDASYTTTALRVGTTEITEAPVAPSGVENPDAGYAYMVDWNQRHAPKALGAIWEAGYRVRSLRRTTTHDNYTFSRGSLVILIGRNYEHRDRIAADMQRIAAETGVRIIGFDSGRADDGADLASAFSTPVEAPRVALMVDSPFSSYTAGQLWFLFDRWTEFGISRIRTSTLPGLDLSTYDVILMPGAFGLSRFLDSTQVDRLQRWVRAGGTLIGTESSALFLTKGQSGMTNIELAPDPDAPDPKQPKESLDPASVGPYEARRDSTGLQRIPGSAFRSHLDVTHPLAFGMPDRLYSLKQNTTAFEPSRQMEIVGYYDADAANVVASGYASQKNRRKLANKAFATVQRMGQGKVVLLLDNTQYRMFWVGPARLVQNAVMLLPSM